VEESFKELDEFTNEGIYLGEVQVDLIVLDRVSLALHLAQQIFGVFAEPNLRRAFEPLDNIGEVHGVRVGLSCLRNIRENEAFVRPAQPLLEYQKRARKNVEDRVLMDVRRPAAPLRGRPGTVLPVERLNTFANEIEAVLQQRQA